MRGCNNQIFSITIECQDNGGAFIFTGSNTTRLDSGHERSNAQNWYSFIKDGVFLIGGQ